MNLIKFIHYIITILNISVFTILLWLNISRHWIIICSLIFWILIIIILIINDLIEYNLHTRERVMEDDDDDRAGSNNAAPSITGYHVGGFYENFFNMWTSVDGTTFDVLINTASQVHQSDKIPGDTGTLNRIGIRSVESDRIL
jgi:hypothetical protein